MYEGHDKAEQCHFLHSGTPCVAGHFSIRTFDVRPVPLHKVKLNTH
jgi:hypothetical protein